MRKFLLLAPLLLTACEVGPDYAMPRFELPERWFSEKAAEAPERLAPAPKWWMSFNDATLNALEEEGLAANADIMVATARVAEARAALRITDADLYPTLSAEASAVRIGPSTETASGRLSSGKPYNNFALSAVLDYEIDLWGKLRRASESSRAQLLSQQANHDAVRLAVASDIATGYFNLRALDSQISITQATIASRNSAYDYQGKQYKAGAIDVLTFRRAGAELASAQATLPQLTQARVEQQHALSILLGRSPKAIIGAPLTKQDPIAALPAPPVMPADAPSSLLKRRPDVAAAEQQLIAANARIGVALADYYPNLSLSALLGLASADIDRLLRSSAKNWDGGLGSAMPVLDFGHTGGNVDTAKAQEAQARASYEQTVRHAFADVGDALSRVSTSEERLAAQTRAVAANEEAFRIANLRFHSGYATQLDQLDAQRQLFQAQLDQVDATQAWLGAAVTLAKALGGGWEGLPAEQ